MSGTFLYVAILWHSTRLESQFKYFSRLLFDTNSSSACCLLTRTKVRNDKWALLLGMRARKTWHCSRVGFSGANVTSQGIPRINYYPLAELSPWALFAHSNAYNVCAYKSWVKNACSPFCVLYLDFFRNNFDEIKYPVLFCEYFYSIISTSLANKVQEKCIIAYMYVQCYKEMQNDV